MPDFLTRRNNTWHFVRRVPNEFARLDRRGVIKHSTRIKIANDRAGRRAARVAERFNEQLELFWKGLSDGKPQEELTSYEMARRRARALGFDYVENEQLLQQKPEARLERLEALATKGLANDGSARAALLGTRKRPAFMLSKLFEQYEAATKDEVKDLSPDQLRIWRNGRIRAVERFVEVVGNKPVNEVTEDDAIDYCEWWRDRVVDDEVEAKTANKDIGQLSRMLKEMNVRRRLNLPDIFKGLRLKGETERSRAPYDTDFIQDRLLAGDALAGLNEDARLVLYVVADTGMRPSEVVNLQKDAILLGASIPYVKVLPDGRRLKTDDSRTGDPFGGGCPCGDEAASTRLPALSRQILKSVRRVEQVSAGKRAAAHKGTHGLFLAAQLQGPACRRRSAGQPDRQPDGPQDLQAQIRQRPIAGTEAQISSADRFQAAGPGVRQQARAGARLGVFHLLQFRKLGLEFLVHRHMHVAVKLDEIGKQNQSAFNALNHRKLVLLVVSAW